MSSRGANTGTAGHQLESRNLRVGQEARRSHSRTPSSNEVQAADAVRRARDLMPWLARTFPALDVADLEDAMSRALIDWCASENTRSATHTSRFLLTAALRNARDIVKSEAARKVRQGRWLLWFESSRAHVHSDTENADQVLRTACDRIEEQLPDDAMRAVFRLRRKGVRNWRPYASALGLRELSEAELRRAVKKQKDRLDHYLRRHAGVLCSLAQGTPVEL